MPSDPLAPILLVLALALSWPRFTCIFHVGTDTTLATVPLTMVASAISLAAFGLALTSNGILYSVSLATTGVVLAQAIPTAFSSLAVLASAISLGGHLELVTKSIL